MNKGSERSKIKCAQYSEMLGVKRYGDATRKLSKILLFGLGQKLGKDICLICGTKVNFEDYTIGHIEPWMRSLSRKGDVDLYWSVDNINLQHSWCNTIEDKTKRCDSEIEIPEEYYTRFKNVKHKGRRLLYSFEYNTLGMCAGVARQKLIRKIIFEWAEQLGMNNCYRCNKSIKNQKVWTIEHMTPWLSGKTDEEKRKLFFSFDNCSFSHRSCNCGAGHLGKSVSGYNGVGLHKDRKRNFECWVVRISIDGKLNCLLYTQDLMLAAEAWDIAIIKFRDGEGPMNFPEKTEKYKAILEKGDWLEIPKCKICGGEHHGLGYCSKHFVGCPERKLARKASRLRVRLKDPKNLIITFDNQINKYRIQLKSKEFLMGVGETKELAMTDLKDQIEKINTDKNVYYGRWTRAIKEQHIKKNKIMPV